MQLSVSVPLPYREPLSVQRMAEAIRHVENAKLESPPGPAGERGVYQITLAVWQQHSSAPHAWASSSREVCRAETYRVVLRHLDHLRVQLATAKPAIPDTPFFVALSWSAGAAATINRTSSDAKRDYAQRAQNCYLSLSRNTDLTPNRARP